MTIIFIDHVVNVLITKQTILLFNNIDKLNFRLIRTSVYLFQFRLNIRYRFNKRYVILNTLFRLLTKKLFLNESNNLNLKNYHSDIKNLFANNQCFAYHEALINISLAFRQQLIDDYAKKKL